MRQKKNDSYIYHQVELRVGDTIEIEYGKKVQITHIVDNAIVVDVCLSNGDIISLQKAVECKTQHEKRESLPECTCRTGSMYSTCKTKCKNDLKNLS